MAGSKKMLKKGLEKKIVSILRKYGARKIAIFGSYAHGKEGPKSDLDILVDFAGRKSLLELVKIEREVSEAIGVKVDLLTEKAISPYLIDSIKSEAVVIYE